MPQITYKNVTGGQAFGDAGRFFDRASDSLNRAITGAKDTAESFIAGAKDEQTKRTDEALTRIQGVKTAADQAQLEADIYGAGGVQNLFQGTDANKLTQALQNVGTQVRTEDERRFQEGETQRTRTEAEQLRTAKQSIVGMSSADIRKMITSDTPAHVATALNEQADKVFERKKKVTEQDKEDRKLSVLAGLQSVDPQGDTLTFEAKHQAFREKMQELRASKKFSNTELSAIENENRNALGLTESVGLSRLYDSILDQGTGQVIDEFITTDSKTGERTFNLAKFRKLAKSKGYSKPAMQTFEKFINDFTGKTARDAEELRQQRRSESFEDFKDREEYKHLIKNNDPARVNELMQALDATDDLGGLSDSSRVEAAKALSELETTLVKEKLGELTVQDQVRLIRFGFSGEDDFEPKVFKTFANEFLLRRRAAKNSEDVSTTNQGTRTNRSGRSILRP